MRGAFGKPTGTVARVNIGQILISVRAKDSNKAVVIEALRRAKYKFPGRQYIIVSNKWGFTPYGKEEFAEMRQNGTLIPDGWVSVNGRSGRPLIDVIPQMLRQVHSAQGSFEHLEAQDGARSVNKCSNVERICVLYNLQSPRPCPEPSWNAKQRIKASYRKRRDRRQTLQRKPVRGQGLSQREIKSNEARHEAYG